MKLTRKEKIFLPAKRDRFGNIVVGRMIKKGKFVATAILLLILVVMLLLIFLFDGILEFMEANPRVGLLFMGLCSLYVWVFTYIWTSKVIIADKYIKVYSLWNRRIINFEDVEKVGFVWKYGGFFVIRSKRERGIFFPFGEVGTVELVELFIRKCNLESCMEVYDEVEIIKGKMQNQQGNFDRG